MSKKRLMLAGLLGAAALVSTGCGNACEQAASRMSEKYEECGITLPDARDPEREDVQCTGDDADSARLSADCIEKASCEEVRSGDWIFTC